jgi:prevent-host-death family protein
MTRKRVNVHAAKTQLSRLIEDACNGEEVVICRRNVPVVRLVSVRQKPKRRKFGAMKGRAKVTAAFFEPLAAEELAAWET